MSENISVIQSIELKLHESLALTDSKFAPPTLVQALHHAVFPGGARIRPQLCLAVAAACGNDDPALSLAAAAASNFSTHSMTSVKMECERDESAFMLVAATTRWLCPTYIELQGRREAAFVSAARQPARAQLQGRWHLWR